MRFYVHKLAIGGLTNISTYSEDLLKTASFCLNRMYNRRSQILTSN